MCFEEVQAVNKTDYKDMWVFIERDGDSVLPVSLELCSETRRLCDASGEKLVAVIVGSISDGELQRVLDCGVDKIIHVTGTGYDYFNNDAYTNLFTVLCRKYRPTAVMVGGTINGRDFAPRFAARLGTGCTSDATELVWDPKTTDIEFVEPAVGGKMMAVITVPVARPQVGTIRPGTFKCVPCGARAHEVIEEHIDFPVADIRTEILDFRADDLDERLNIADADVIVCVGNAIKGADALPRYRRLAERLGGKLACTGLVFGGAGHRIDLSCIVHTGSLVEVGVGDVHLDIAGGQAVFLFHLFRSEGRDCHSAYQHSGRKCTCKYFFQSHCNTPQSLV